MDKKIEHITAGIVIGSPNELHINVIGERLHDYSAYFSDLFLDRIQAAIGHQNWGVWFKQFDEIHPKFIVDIYVNDINDFKPIHDIIVGFKGDEHDDPILEMMAPKWNFDEFLQETGQLSP